jgi:hypothetical protein
MQALKQAAALIIGWICATPALGQEDCLASFNVNPSKSLTYLLIGPNASDRIVTAMSCSVAENMRDQLFATGQTTDAGLLGNVDQLRSKISEIKMRLAAGRTELENAMSMPAHLSAVQYFKDIVLAAGVASATIGCIVSAETCKPAVEASAALYELALSASKVRELPQARAQAEAEISTLESMLQTIQERLNDSIAQQSKLRFGIVLSQMCRSIKQQCQ